MYVRDERLRRLLNAAARVMRWRPVAFPPIPADGQIRFYHRDRATFGFLSNFTPAPITVDGVRYPTVEHFYQAQKSTDPDYRHAVATASSPGKAKRLADSRVGSPRIAKQSWFRHRPDLLRADWAAVKPEVMRIGVQAKFAQNADLRAMLLWTGDATLVEDSPSDSFWGVGAGENGQNNLGKLLMEVRAGHRRRAVR